MEKGLGGKKRRGNKRVGYRVGNVRVRDKPASRELCDPEQADIFLYL